MTQQSVPGVTAHVTTLKEALEAIRRFSHTHLPRLFTTTHAGLAAMRAHPMSWSALGFDANTQSTTLLGVPLKVVEPLPERDPSRAAEEQGLFRKFEVRRTDGSDAPGGRHHGCEYLVLDLTHDPHAAAAAIFYAGRVMATHPQLAADIVRRYGDRT